MKLPLKQAVRDHVQQRALSPGQLRALSELQMREPAPRSGGGAGRRLLPWALAATVAAAAVLGVGLHLAGREAGPRDIAAEVAQNHIKLKPLEVQTGELDAVRGYFTELDFALVDSARLDPQHWELLGGRYCSIQGVTAAQLRVKDRDSGQVQSLYQAPYDPDKFVELPRLEEGQPPVSLDINGVRVRIWVERGILFALTGD